MADKKRDPELEAFQAVHAALTPLAPEERNRVLTSIYVLLGIEGPKASPSPAAAQPSGAFLAPQVPLAHSTRPLSLNELIKDKAPGTNVQRITLFAYYRDKHQDNPRFSRDDLKSYFSLAKEHPPSNYDRDFVEAVKKGWIHEDGADSYITSKGIEAVEAGFPGERKHVNHGPRKAGRSATKKAK